MIGKLLYAIYCILKAMTHVQLSSIDVIVGSSLQVLCRNEPNRSRHFSVISWTRAALPASWACAGDPEIC